MTPDGEMWPHITDHRCRELAVRGHNETVAELVEAGVTRGLAAIDEALDALEEIERERPGAMKWARSHLVDARQELTALHSMAAE